MIGYKEEDLILLPKQGHCNHNYLLEKNDKRYLLRKFRLLDRDRKKEFRIQKRVAKVGIAPKPYYLDEAIMITDFVKGKHHKRLTPRQTKALALALKKLHTIPYHDKPVRYPRANRFHFDGVLCHGDLSVGNVLFSKRVMLIDWEYACVADRYFDLACVCESFDFHHGSFFRAYGISLNRAKLRVYREIFKELSQVWFDKLHKGKLAFCSP